MRPVLPQTLILSSLNLLICLAEPAPEAWCQLLSDKDHACSFLLSQARSWGLGAGGLAAEAAGAAGARLSAVLVCCGSSKLRASPGRAHHVLLEPGWAACSSCLDLLMPWHHSGQGCRPALGLLALLCHLAVSPGTEEGLLTLPLPRLLPSLFRCQDLGEGLGTVTSRQRRSEAPPRCSPGLLTPASSPAFPRTSQPLPQRQNLIFRGPKTSGSWFGPQFCYVAVRVTQVVPSVSLSLGFLI